MHHYFLLVKVFNLHQTSLAEWIVAIATSLAVILAVGGEKIKRWIIKPKLHFLDIKITSQNVGEEQDIIMFRLHLENKGWNSAKAKNVKAIVASVVYSDITYNNTYYTNSFKLDIY